MAPHELSFSANGEAEMFYTGDRKPWHGFGQELDRPATADEAIRAAHLDWNVTLTSVHDSAGHQVDPYRFVVRTDNGKKLGIRTKTYSVVQNVDAFGLFDAIIGPGQGVYETAGALREGRIVWILASMGDPKELVIGDEIRPYVLLSTSHDGSLPLQLRQTPIRVVCWNTLQYAVRAKMRGRSNSDVVTIRHTGNVERKAVNAREVLGLTEVYFERMMEGANALVDAQLNGKSLDDFAFSLFSPRNEHHIHPNTEEDILKLKHLFTNGRGQDIPGVRGTAWAAYNAATEFVDYFQRVGHGELGEAPDARLYKAWFKSGRGLKIRAWELLQDYANRGDLAWGNVRRLTDDEVTRAAYSELEVA